MKCVALSLFLTASAVAQPATWSDVPEIYTTDPALWRSVFNEPRKRVVHVVIFGDSQETCPQGAGSVYVVALNREFAEHYGTCGATPLLRAGEAFGGGAPWAEWLVRSASAPPAMMLSPRYTTAEIPPGARLAQTSAITGANANGSQRYGWLVCLDSDAAWTDPGANASGTPWIDTTGGVYIDVMGWAHPGSSELVVEISTTTGTPTYYGSAVGTYTSAMGLDDVAGPKFQTFGPFTVPAGAKLQAEIYGNDPAKVADVAHVRFRSAASPKGIVVSDCAEGGYWAHTMGVSHADCGPFLTALNIDVAWFAYGANDGGNGLDPADWKADVLDRIAQVRAASGPDLPVVIAVESYREISNPAFYDDFDRYAGAAKEIADADSRVLVLNGRKLTDAAGWNDTGYGSFLVDAAHYTALGGRTKASVEAGALLDAFRCDCDFTRDGFLDIFDYDAFDDAFELGSLSADFNRDGFLDFFDYDDFVIAFETGC